MPGPVGTLQDSGCRGDRAQTFTITTVPNELCGAIHDRMPIILPREKWATWLGQREADPDELRWMVLRP